MGVRWTGGNGLVVSQDAVGVINWLEVVNDEVATVPHGHRYLTLWTRDASIKAGARGGLYFLASSQRHLSASRTQPDPT